MVRVNGELILYSISSFFVVQVRQEDRHRNGTENLVNFKNKTTNHVSLLKTHKKTPNKLTYSPTVEAQKSRKNDKMNTT